MHSDCSVYIETFHVVTKGRVLPDTLPPTDLTALTLRVRVLTVYILHHKNKASEIVKDTSCYQRTTRSTGKTSPYRHCTQWQHLYLVLIVSEPLRGGADIL